MINSIKYFHDNFESLLAGARAEIEGLRQRIIDNEEEIEQLNAGNIDLQRQLVGAQRQIAARVAEIQAVQRIMGIEQPMPDVAPLEELARRLVESLAQRQQRIQALEEGNRGANEQIDRLHKKISIMTVSIAVVIAGAGVGTVAYKVSKFVAGAKVGVVAGGQIGAAVGAAGGPVFLFSATIVGSAIGGITGGVCTALV